MYDLTLDELDAPVVLPRGEIGCGVITAGGGIITEFGFSADPPDGDAWPDRWTADTDRETIRPDGLHVEEPGGEPVVRWLLEELR